MKSIVYSFSDANAVIPVALPEMLRADYGLYAWPCATALAAVVFANRKEFKGECKTKL